MYRKLSSRTSNTSGATPMHSALLSHRSKSTTTFMAAIVHLITPPGQLAKPNLTSANVRAPSISDQCAAERSVPAEQRTQCVEYRGVLDGGRNRLVLAFVGPIGDAAHGLAQNLPGPC